MFDVGFSEIVLIAIVAIIAIGPEEMPEMLFRLGRLVRQGKMFVGNIRNQYSEIMHEAEVEHYRKKLDPKLLGEANADSGLTPPDIREIPLEKPADLPDERA